MKGTTPSYRESRLNPGKKWKEERKYQIQRKGGKTGNILLKPDETTGVEDEGAKRNRRDSSQRATSSLRENLRSERVTDRRRRTRKHPETEEVIAQMKNVQ